VSILFFAILTVAFPPEPTEVFDRRSQLQDMLEGPNCRRIAEWYVEDAWEMDRALSDAQMAKLMQNICEERLHREFQDCMSGPYSEAWLAIPRWSLLSWRQICHWRWNVDGDRDIDLYDWYLFQTPNEEP